MKRLISTLLFLSLSAFVFGQSITLDPRTTQVAGVQVASDLAFRKQKRETVNGGWTNYPRDNSSVLIFEGGGSLNGIADGQDGVIVYVFNGYPTGVTTGQLLLQHENTTSLAANRILTPDGLDFPVGNGGVALIYDGTKQRWRVATPAQTGGPTFSGWGLNGNGGTNPTTNFIGTTDAQGFTVKTNNLERISIESGGNVGIGITMADAKLHVARGSAGTVTSHVNTIGTFENNTSGYLSILTPSTNEGGIVFGSPSSNSRGFFTYSHSTDKMRFATSGTEKMMIDGNGNIGIGTTTVATGVKFHLDNGSSGVTPNSGGTWSPTLFMERNGHNYLEIASPDANERGIVFSNPTDGNSGGVYYNSKNMSFRTNSNDTRLTIRDNGNVGIGTTAPNATLDVFGEIALSKRIKNEGITGTFNNLNTQGASVHKYFNNSNVTITGIAGGTEGKIIIFFASPTSTIVLKHNSAGSLFENRIVTNTAADITITSGSVTLMYDGDTTVWKIIATSL